MSEDPLAYDSRTIAADWFERYHEPVVGQLRSKYPWVDQELLHDAFVDALLQICKDPDRFDATREVSPFLFGAAERSLYPLRRTDNRRVQREQKKAEMSVGDDGSAVRDISEVVANKELAEIVRGKVARTKEERRILELWEQGEDDVTSYARVLGVNNDPPEQQRAAVKLVLDRVLHRARRLRKDFQKLFDGTYEK